MQHNHGQSCSRMTQSVISLLTHDTVTDNTPGTWHTATDKPVETQRSWQQSFWQTTQQLKLYLTCDTMMQLVAMLLTTRSLTIPLSHSAKTILLTHKTAFDNSADTQNSNWKPCSSCWQSCWHIQNYIDNPVSKHNMTSQNLVDKTLTHNSFWQSCWLEQFLTAILTHSIVIDTIACHHHHQSINCKGCWRHHKWCHN